jgi:hypothetical protein
VSIPLEVVRVRQMIDRRQQLAAERAPIAAHTADRDAAEANAVVAALASDQYSARSFAADAVVGEGDLQRRVDGLGAGACEEHVIEPGRGDLRESLRGLERDPAVHLKGGRVIERRGLSADRLDDRLPAVSGVHGPETRDAVEDPPSVARRVIHTVGGDEQTRRRFELAVRRERQPQRLEVQIFRHSTVSTPGRVARLTDDGR